MNSLTISEILTLAGLLEVVGGAVIGYILFNYRKKVSELEGGIDVISCKIYTIEKDVVEIRQSNTFQADTISSIRDDLRNNEDLKEIRSSLRDVSDTLNSTTLKVVSIQEQFNALKEQLQEMKPIRNNAKYNIN